MLISLDKVRAASESPELSVCGLGPSRGAKMVLPHIASPVCGRGITRSPPATGGGRQAVFMAVADLSRAT